MTLALRSNWLTRACFASFAVATVLAGVPAVAQNVSTTIGDPASSTFDEVNGDQIERNNADRLDEALEDIPGITLTRQSGLGITATVDGLPASQVSILVDGVPVNRPLNSRAGPATDLASVPVDPESIRRIDVHRGAGPAGSGDAGGVVVNIVTEQRNTTHARISIQGGVAVPSEQSETVWEQGVDGTLETPVSDAVVIGVTGGFSTESASDVDVDGKPDRPFQSLSSGRTHVRWRPSAGDALTLRLGYNHTRTRRDALTSSEEQSRAEDSPALLNGLFNDRTRLGVLDARLLGEWRPNRDWLVEHATTLVHQRVVFDKERVRDEVYLPNHTTRDIGVRQGVLATAWLGDHEVQPELVLRGGHTTRTNHDDEEDVLDDIAAGYFAVGAGLAERWEPTPHVIIYARGFGEMHSDFGAGGVANLRFDLRHSEAFGGYISGAYTRRTPTPEELYFRFDHAEVGYVIEGNADLRPEVLQGGRAGLEGRVGMWSYSVEGYAQQLRHAISASGLTTDAVGATTFQYDNVGEVTSAGLNSAVRFDDLPGGLALNASYAWLPHSHVAETDARLAFTTEHDGSVTLSGAWSRDRLEAWARVRSRSALTVPVGSPEADPSTTLDAAVAYNFTASLRGQLTVENIGGVVHPTWGPFSRQTVFVTLTYRHEEP